MYTGNIIHMASKAGNLREIYESLYGLYGLEIVDKVCVKILAQFYPYIFFGHMLGTLSKILLWNTMSHIDSLVHLANPQANDQIRIGRICSNKLNKGLFNNVLFIYGK